MALPNGLIAQQNMHPFAWQNIQTAMQQSADNARAQEQMALQQLATTPNMRTKAQPATTEDDAPRTLAPLPSDTSPMRNLGFSQLNAIASTTPQAKFQPTTIPGGGIAQGMTNLFNIQEQRKMQGALMDMARQQQAAQQQAIQQQQAAAQAKIDATAQGIMALDPSIPPEAARAMAYNDVTQMLQTYGTQVGTKTGEAAGSLRALPTWQQVTQSINPDNVPALSTNQQILLDKAMGGDINTYQNVQNQAKAAQEIITTAKQKGTLPSDIQQAQLGVEETKTNIEGTRLKNQITAAVEASRQLKESELSASQKAAREAVNKLDGVFSSNPQAYNDPNLVRNFNAAANVLNIPTLDMPTSKVGTVKAGKNQSNIYQQTGDTITIIDPKSGEIIGTTAPTQPVVTEITPPAAPVVEQAQPAVTQGVIEPQPNIEQQLISQISAAKPNTEEQQALMTQLQDLRNRQAEARRLQQATQNTTISVDPSQLQTTPLDIGGLQFNPLGPTVPIEINQGF